MNSFVYVMPWAMPGPLGLFFGTGMAPLALVLAGVLLAVDVVLYLPFIKAYDATLVAEESRKHEEIVEEEREEAEENKAEEAGSLDHDLNVLVLCVGAGTSAMFANAVNKGAEAENLPVKARAEAFGAHTDILKDFQLVVLSPQVQSRYDEIAADASQYGIKLVRTKGAQYIQLTKDPKGAVEFVVKEANRKE